MSSATIVLVDTNVIIEAVRTNCWNALTGGRHVATVSECHAEATRGDSLRTGYIRVSITDLERLRKVLAVSMLERATFAMSYPGAAMMDSGERDLFAHAFQRHASGDDLLIVTSPDKASVRAAVELGWGDRMHSLEAIMATLGSRPKPRLGHAHTEAWLSTYRTQLQLGG